MQLEKKQIDVGGRLTEVDALKTRDKEIVVTGSCLRIARLEGDGYEDVDDPALLVKDMRAARFPADVFTFVQPASDAEPDYGYYSEHESVAALPITTFDHWWHKQIPQETRTGVRKAEKSGVVVRIVEFGDELVRGIHTIYNESPMRQGKPFAHYGKDLELLKTIHGTFLNASDFLGAYYKGELVGFMKLTYARRCAGTMNIISMLAHRDKRVMNALVAKAVETCANRQIPYLTYCAWSRGGLGEFKLRNGFQPMEVPRYYVPLTLKGAVAVRFRLHRGIRQILPDELKDRLVELRTKWYASPYAKGTWRGALRGKAIS
jgi:hypothetical protein